MYPKTLLIIKELLEITQKLFVKSRTNLNAITRQAPVSNLNKEALKSAHAVKS